MHGNQLVVSEGEKKSTILESLLETNEVLLYEWIDELQDGGGLEVGRNRLVIQVGFEHLVAIRK